MKEGLRQFFNALGQMKKTCLRARGKRRMTAVTIAVCMVFTTMFSAVTFSSHAEYRAEVLDCVSITRSIR